MIERPDSATPMSAPGPVIDGSEAVADAPLAEPIRLSAVAMAAEAPVDAGAETGGHRRTGDFRGRPRGYARRERGPFYAALDLGTNNCRLLIAEPAGERFRVVDSFSRIVRLGEGVAQSGSLKPRGDGAGDRRAHASARKSSRCGRSRAPG